LNGETRGKSFVRRERPKKGRDKKAEPDREAETQAKPHPEIPKDQPLDTTSRARIVIPRQERGSSPPGATVDIELREVRYGATSRGPYLRVVPSKQRLTKVQPGYVEATRLGSQPLSPLGRAIAGARALVLGTPLAASQIVHERLTKFKALAILGSDPLSSSTYATEEALIVLALAGSAALGYSIPIALVVALLLLCVAISYRQTIRAYPSGGGAYAVAHDNFGPTLGLAAAASLIVDYVLLVSVSVAAGVAAITSAAPELLDWRVPLAVGCVALFTIGNLRGIRESGTLFAAPTYFFIIAMATVIIGGLIKVIIGDAPGTLFDQPPPREEVVATQGVTVWLILRAFSSGSTALTGVEAISNGVPTFKEPAAENARATMTIMAALAIFLFLGITFTSNRFGIVPSEEETVVSMLGREVLGENVIYFAYQAATALVLFLAANTSYNAFPLLSAILARDRYMPRQFTFRGDRLAYSNGILLLAALAALLLVVFDARVTRLIPLYAVGVFIPFALSQSGMVRRWLRLKGPGWRASLALNALGALATAAVAVIIAITKFTEGAWISLVIMGVLMVMFGLIHRHYTWFEERIRVDRAEVPVGVPRAVRFEPGGPRDHVVVPVDAVNRISLGAIGVAREISGRVTAVHLTDDREEAERFREEWNRAVPDVPLLIIESPFRAFVAPMVAFIESLERTSDQRIVVVLPGFKAKHWWERALHNRDVMRLKPYLEKRPRVRVVDFRYELQERRVA
jgi:amino acid transporter